MKYPDRKTYDTLYARYVNSRAPDQFVQLAMDKLGRKDLSGLTSLDLCAGAGRISKVCLEAGARVVMVDNEPNMLSHTVAGRSYDADVLSFLAHFKAYGEKPFDLVFCQQAINYWIERFPAAMVLSKAMAPGGVFVFNTFNRCPPSHPIPKTYQFEGRQYTELSYARKVGKDDPLYPRVNARVEHIQICDDMPLHHTSFDWVPPERFEALLEDFFTIDRHTDRNTDLYVCQKR